MQELEKILEEIDRNATEVFGHQKVINAEMVKEIICKYMTDGWIPVEERLPEEKLNPITNDYYEYQVTAKFGNATDVRSYKFGKGHWWHGPGIMDDYVIAWRERPEPYRPERRKDES